MPPPRMFPVDIYPKQPLRTRNCAENALFVAGRPPALTESLRLPYSCHR